MNFERKDGEKNPKGTSKTQGFSVGGASRLTVGVCLRHRETNFRNSHSPMIS
jgi:hypothetical protein